MFPFDNVKVDRLELVDGETTVSVYRRAWNIFAVFNDVNLPVSSHQELTRFSCQSSKLLTLIRSCLWVSMRQSADRMQMRVDQEQKSCCRSVQVGDYRNRKKESLLSIDMFRVFLHATLTSVLPLSTPNIFFGPLLLAILTCIYKAFD